MSLLINTNNIALFWITMQYIEYNFSGYLLDIKNKLMNNNIIDKFLNFIEKEVVPPIKKDFTGLSKSITKDLEKLTKDKRHSKKKE